MVFVPVLPIVPISKEKQTLRRIAGRCRMRSAGIEGDRGMEVQGIGVWGNKGNWEIRIYRGIGILGIGR